MTAAIVSALDLALVGAGSAAALAIGGLALRLRAPRRTPVDDLELRRMARRAERERDRRAA